MSSLILWKYTEKRLILLIFKDIIWFFIDSHNLHTMYTCTRFVEYKVHSHMCRILIKLWLVLKEIKRALVLLYPNSSHPHEPQLLPFFPLMEKICKWYFVSPQTDCFHFGERRCIFIYMYWYYLHVQVLIIQGISGIFIFCL